MVCEIPPEGGAEPYLASDLLANLTSTWLTSAILALSGGCCVTVGPGEVVWSAFIVTEVSQGTAHADTAAIGTVGVGHASSTKVKIVQKETLQGQTITKTCPYNMHRFFFSEAKIENFTGKALMIFLFLLKT